ncbi:MAG: AAA family ATPase [Pseudaminobacter sp.]
MPFCLRLLGGFELYRNETQLHIASVKQRCLIASLALAMPGRCNRDDLAEKLWGWRHDGSAKQSLRTALTHLRKQFTPDQPLVAHHEEVGLNPEQMTVDALQFQTLLGADDPQSLQAAAQLYRGDFLDGLRVREGDIERWISDQRGWYRSRAQEVLVKLSALALAASDFDRAIDAARRAVQLDDLAEESHRALLNALIAGNRRGEAMRHARSMLDLFESALSVTPSAETMAVIDKIRLEPETRERPAEPEMPAPVADSPINAAAEPAPAAGKQGLIEQSLIVALSYEIAGVASLAANGTDAEGLAEVVDDLTRILMSVAGEWFGVANALGPEHGTIFFGVEGQTEDYASDALTAAIDLGEAISNYRSARHPEHRFALKAALDDGVALVITSETVRIVGAPELRARVALKKLAEPAIVITESLRGHISGYFRLQPYPGQEKKEGGIHDTLWTLVAPKRQPDRFHAMRRRILPLVGRRSELEMLTGRWADACAGNGQVAILRGESGIGKSRLVHDLRGRLKAAGARLWALQCNPNGRQTPFAPLLNMFAGPRRKRDRPEQLFVRAMRRLGLEQTESITQLGTTAGIISLASPAPAALPVKEALRLTRRAIGEIVGALASKGPACLIVEDIHWADASTLAELEALGRWIEDKPILIVATTRDDALRAMTSEGNTLDLTLRRLDRSEAAALATAMWEMAADERPSAEQIASIAGLSDGIPLFLEEMVLWRIRSGQHIGASPPLRTDEADNQAVPLTNLLISRINALGQARILAQIAAVIGQSFDFSTLREVAQNMLPEETLPELASLLVDQHILRQTWPLPEAEYEFRHTLLREAAYSSLRDTDRRVLHERVFRRLEREQAAGTPVNHADLAWHAERAGNFREAADIMTRWGRESAARSAISEARSALARALRLTDNVDEIDARSRLQLDIIAAYGPLVISHAGPRDEQAKQLYARGVDIARQRPAAERVDWFPVFWGWWYTGSDFRAMHDRALRVQEMLADVDDPEIVLQINHCIWAIDFNLGRHRETLEAIEKGLACYDDDRARLNRALFGGHDAKVCGLGQKALSLWLTGRTVESDRALLEMMEFVDRIGHLASKAHSLDTEAVSAFYRDDHERLAEVAARMDRFASEHEMDFLAGLAMLFGGWAEAQQHDLADGLLRLQRGLDTLKQLGSVVDLPIYLDMQATLLARAGKIREAFEVVSEAIAEAEQSGHAYWLAELYRRRAELRSQLRADAGEVAADLKASLTEAREQGALALVRRSEQSAREIGLAVET